MISIFIFISGATLLVYSAERLIGSLVGVSRGLAISVFLLAIIFTGIEFDDIVLGIALNLEDDQDVALGLVLGTAVSFSGIVLALGAILTPTRFSIPREYIVVFALAPLIMLVFAIRQEVTTIDAIVLILLFVAWIAYVAARESKRETATFRNLEIIEEAEEQEEQQVQEATSIPVRTQAVNTMSHFSREATPNVDRAPQALARRRPADPVRGLLGHQLRRLRRRPGRRLNTLAREGDAGERHDGGREAVLGLAGRAARARA